MYALANMNVTEEQLKNLFRRKYRTAENYLRTPPKTFHCYDKVMPLNKNLDGKDVAIAGALVSVSGKNNNNGRYIVSVRVKDFATGQLLYVNLIGQFYMQGIMAKWGTGTPVIVGGKLQYNESYNTFAMLNPYVLTKNVLEGMMVYPDYGTMKSFEREDILHLHKECLDLRYDEFIPPYLLDKYGIMDVNRFLKNLHEPENQSDFNKAKYRIKFEHLLYFAIKMEKNIRSMPRSTAFIIEETSYADKFIKMLPYDLTKDQKEIYEELVKNMKQRRRVNALIQGDVGSGKTTVAFLAMFLMAGAGYQSVLMAPTCVLAKQHYEELSSYAEKMNLKVAFLGGKQGKREKNSIIKGIKEGKYSFIVGTNGVFSRTVEYKNLGLVVTDEEHKFGVLQRNAVTESVNNCGIHTITMSATPIPRTIAQTLYGETMDIFTIKTKPAGRQPVDTTVYNNKVGIFKFIEKEIEKGHQAYVVCPLIETADEKSKMSEVESVEKTYAEYNAYFSGIKKEGKDVNIECITGKMSETEINEKIDRFAKNESQILIATTIVEVGVNVPNASVIVINNAERFGMASLHQLRGRVGRGNVKSYCILKSDCKEKGDEKSLARLNGICQTNDGFEIALCDLRNRGTGELLGEKQSGKNIYIDLMLEDKALYQKLREEASVICDNGTENNFITVYEQIYDINIEEE